MLYYFMPDTAISGRIKVAYQFVDALNALGVQACIASPEGLAATWFSSHAAVVDAAAVRESFRPTDIAVFFRPDDYLSLRGLPGQLVFHCMGSDSLMHQIFADSTVRVLTRGRHATQYALIHGAREPLETGISIAPCFAYSGEPKFERAVAYMPRRDASLCEAVKRRYKTLRYFAIDGMREGEAARVMKRCSIYLATSENDGLGLPALEAMSAGCVVVSVPTPGAMEYLDDGVNCRIAAPQDFTAAFGELLTDASAELRFRLRQAEIATAMRYTAGQMMERISALISGPLSDWRKT
jgi:glycosyltransferase involved in cell wall biosynthesis